MPGKEFSPDSQQQSQPVQTNVESQPKVKRARGLAAADPETRRQVARKGGEAVSRNKKHMAEIGKKGGEAVSQDRKHMASIGRKGGEAVSQNREHMAEIGRKGGEARGTKPHHEGEEGEQSLQSTEAQSQGFGIGKKVG